MIVNKNHNMVAEAGILSVQCISDAVSIGQDFFDVSTPSPSQGFLEVPASESISIEISRSESVLACSTSIQVTSPVSTASKFLPCIRSGSHTDIGPRRSNEDEHIRIDDLSAQLGSEYKWSLPSSFYAVFDGHGGSDASAYVKNNAMRLFFEDADLPQTSDIDDVFLEDLENSHRKAFLLADQALADECSHKSGQVNFELWREAQAYGDIQLMPFVDYYSLLSLKTIAICIMGTQILPAKYIMKTDDDAFVRIDEVLSSLKEKVSDGLLYGLISFESTPQRDKDNKWFISTVEWPHDKYPPWAHGPGYIIARDIAKFIVQGHQKRDLKLFKLEDVSMGIWIEQFKKHGHKVHYMSDDRFYNAGCESNYILAHYQNPRMVLCLWEKLQKEHEPNCCE